jgi:site-specific recombinase XerD
LPRRPKPPPPSRSLVDALPADALRTQIRDFVEFLRFNRNLSDHTARAYESDLEQFLATTATSHGRPRPDITVADFTPDAVRAYLGELYRAGTSRASAARKLAAVRTFGRYLRRERLLASDPASLVASPRR